MSRQRVINSTAAVASATFDAGGCASIIVAADNLVGAEKVEVYVVEPVNENETAVYADGVVVELTPAQPQIVLEGGPRYLFSKTATTGDCAVDVFPRRLS